MRKYLASILALFGCVVFSPCNANAQQMAPPAPAFAIPQSGVSFSTGDTWVQNGQTMRLYGVQACLRGTSYTNPAGVKADCGEASLAYLAAIIRDTKPQCTPIAQVGVPPAILVVCSARVGASILDLATIMLTQGFSFASFTNDGKPVYMPYLVAELTAKKARAGLWAAPDLPHPVALLLQAVQSRR